ncbi:hypothetical protein [Escherichia marmotae]|uniref:hypothetical protein n=1 Tax=Escherichia marmotae TaxID=1499973 RepID=UPI003CF91CA8
MIKYILMLFFMVCSCSHGASLFATSISDGSQAQCAITGLSYTPGDTSPVSLSIYCRYQTQNGRQFALTLGSSKPVDFSMGCNGASIMPTSPLGSVFDSALGRNSSMFPLGYLFNVGAGQVQCQVSFKNAAQMKNPGLYVVGLFSDYQNHSDVWEFNGFVNTNTGPEDFGAVYCYLIAPQSTIDMGIIKPKGVSQQVNVNVGIDCSGATSTINTELGYTIRFDNFSCSDDCSLLGEYISYIGTTGDPADDPEKSFIIHDVMLFKEDHPRNTKSYTTLWKIRDNTGNPREITASAHVEIYYY